MNRQRVIGTQLEILLAELITPGKLNYNIARYVEFRGQLNIEALSRAIRVALNEARLVHYDYEIDPNGAWQMPSEKGGCDVVLMDLRDTPEAMSVCREIMEEDAESIIPAVGDKDKIRQTIFLLRDMDGSQVWIWYQRYHHILVDGYALQLLLRRVSELYGTFSGFSELSAAEFVGCEAVFEEHQEYARSSAMQADKEFWGGYLREYVSQDDRPASSSISAGERPFVRSSCVWSSGKAGDRLPIEVITAATMLELYRASGSSSQMVGMSFGRRNRARIAKVLCPLVSILPLWVDLRGLASLEAAELQVRESLKKIKQHQFYGGEQAIRDLGSVGRGETLYWITLNFRVYVGDVIQFAGVNSAVKFLASPYKGVDLTIDMQGGNIQLMTKSTLSSLWGLSIERVIDRLEDRIRAALACGYGDPALTK